MSIRQGNKIIAGTPDASSVKIDNITLTENQAGDTQAVALVDRNTGYVKTWTGTQAEYDAIEVKDPDTLYNVEDDEKEHDSSIGLDIGDIGFAPLGIDETQNKRRYLNGQVISQAQFVSFTAKVKNAILLYPSLSATEENWQAEVTNSKLGQCGKFVIDDELGTIRLPKVVNINGLQDLALMGSIKAESLPNITGGVMPAEQFDDYSGAFYDNGMEWAHSSGYTTGGNGLGFDASLSSSTYQDNAPVQQEAVQYPYFIQVATGVEESIDVSRDIQLNNPFFFGMSQYFESAPNNASWLLSNGAFHSGSVYVSFYQWLLRIYNGVDTVRGVSVKLHTEEYSFYDYVINTDEQTFRLPIYNGSENIPSAKFEDLTLKAAASTYNPPANGWYNLRKASTGQNQYLLMSTGQRAEQIRSGGAEGSVAMQFYVARGTNLIIDYNLGGTTNFFRFTYATGKGSLYYYVGEAVQDANLISVGNVIELLARLENYDYVVESKVATESDPTWYRVYKSGWVEQGGDVGTSNTITLLKKMSNSSYYVDVTWNGGKSQNFYAYDGQIKNRTTTSFYTTFTTNGTNVKGLCWIVKGQGAK